MEKKKYNEKHSKKIRKLAAFCCLIAIFLSVSTYAWFIGMKRVEVSEFDINIATTEGLFLSMDGSDWTYNLDVANAPQYADNANKLTDVELIPMSTVGDMDVTSSRMKLYQKGSLTATAGGYRLLASQVDNHTARVTSGTEYLEGEELSLISLWDGKSLLHFPPARDFKRFSLSKDSPNTGGMGSYCPVELTEVQQDRLDLYKTKLNFMLSDEKADFIGFIYSGLIWAKNDWYVLEYNMRPGDPETQSILNQLDTDLLYILNAAIYQKLDEIKLRLKNGVSATLVVASDGYPQQPKDGNLIEFPEDKEIVVHYSGVELKDEKLYSKGGRNLSITTSAGDLNTVFNRLYSYSDKIRMENKYVREGLPEN